MDRLSRDLALALEESSCERTDRKKIGLRRRARSAGNLPAAVAVSVLEDGSSSSPPQVPLIAQPLSDSDDPFSHSHTEHLGRNCCQVGNFESDSFNENFSPTRPVQSTRRKRKFKKTPVECTDGTATTSLEVTTAVVETPSLSGPSMLPAAQDSPVKDRGVCVKRKWAHRDVRDDMRERSFSGGCASKVTAISAVCDLPKPKIPDKKIKTTVLQPGRIILKTATATVTTASSVAAVDSKKKPIIVAPTLPGSSSFNFVYKTTSKEGPPQLAKRTVTGFKINNEKSPYFNPVPSTSKVYTEHVLRFRKGRWQNRAALNVKDSKPYEEPYVGMETVNNESSSLSSSDSDNLITNESDREGDDELTDWPGIEELKVFNKSLTFKSNKVQPNIANRVHKCTSNMPPPKRLKKDRRTPTHGWSSSKNKCKNKRPKVDSGNDEDEAVMSDSQSVVDIKVFTVAPPGSRNTSTTLTTFSDVKNAGISGSSVNESFYQSIQAFEEKSCLQEDDVNQMPRNNFSLQKTSSSEMNVSEMNVCEKSPASDQRSEQSGTVAKNISGEVEVREIRAGCRRVRNERPGLLIHSAANEQLAKFLQDSSQIDLRLPYNADPNEMEKLKSLAKLYSLEMHLELGRPVLTKTCNTTQAVYVEQSFAAIALEHKRRCYEENVDPGPSSSMPGPSSWMPGPLTSMPGPSSWMPGPSFSMPGPSSSMPGPSFSMPGPSSSMPGSSFSMVGPSSADALPDFSHLPPTPAQFNTAPIPAPTLISGIINVSPGFSSPPAFEVDPTAHLSPPTPAPNVTPRDSFTTTLVAHSLFHPGDID